MPYVHISDYKLSITEYGKEFILLHSIDGQNLIPIAQAIYHSHFEFAEEVIGTEKEICIKLASTFNSKAHQLLSETKLLESIQNQSYILPVYFGEVGDWPIIEAHSQKSKSELISELTELSFQFHMYGFLPGFLYIKGLPDYLHCPRKAIPDKKVTPGSLAIGGPYLGFYSNPSPGGWHTIGQCALKVFDKSNQPPLKLIYGDNLRLKSITLEEHQYLLDKKLQLHQYG